MELRVLRYFLAVAREENITKAAALLHLTQPTLSRQLMGLEEELGVQLFHRSRPQIDMRTGRRIAPHNRGLIKSGRDKCLHDLIAYFKTPGAYRRPYRNQQRGRFSPIASSHRPDREPDNMRSHTPPTGMDSSTSPMLSIVKQQRDTIGRRDRNGHSRAIGHYGIFPVQTNSLVLRVECKEIGCHRENFGPMDLPGSNQFIQSQRKAQPLPVGRHPSRVVAGMQPHIRRRVNIALHRPVTSRHKSPNLGHGIKQGKLIPPEPVILVPNHYQSSSSSA